MLHSFLIFILTSMRLSFPVDSEERYVAAFNYLENSKEMQNQIVRNFKSFTAVKHPVPSVSDTVIFSDCFPICEDLKDTSFHLTKDERIASGFGDAHYFDTYIDEN